MKKTHYVVIGSGPAGSQAAFTLRLHDADARISVISSTRQSGYCPHRLPAFITGSIDRERLVGCTLHQYDEADIKLRSGQKVVDCDFDSRILTLAHREHIGFDGLIIAVGGRPRIPEWLQSGQDLLYTLKTVEDAERWKRKLATIDSVLIIGGDLSSFAVAKAMLSVDKQVYFLLDQDAFWPIRGNETLLQTVSEQLRQKGVEVVTGRRISSLEAVPGTGCQVGIDDRVLLQVGMVGAFFGLVPDIRFLAGSGLAIDRGILVDDCLFTGLPDIYAAGDCAQIYHPEINDYWISVGYENAKLLGYAAAVNLLGGRKKKVAPESIFKLDGIFVNTSWWSEF